MAAYCACPRGGNYLKTKVAAGGDLPGSLYIRETTVPQPQSSGIPPPPALSDALSDLPSVLNGGSNIDGFCAQFGNSATTHMHEMTFDPRNIASTRDPAAYFFPTRGTVFSAWTSRPRLPLVVSPHKLPSHHPLLSTRRSLLRLSLLASTLFSPPAPTPFASTSRDPFAPLAAICDSLSAEVTAPLRALDDWQWEEDFQRQQAEHALDMRLEDGLRQRQADRAFNHQLGQLGLSPSPVTETPNQRFEREAREDADLQQAVELSLRHPSPAASTSQLHALSPSPDFPLQISVSARGRAVAPAVTDGPAMGSSFTHPTSTSTSTPARGRAAAPAVTRAPVAGPSKRPLRITTQLNEIWMNAPGGPPGHGRPASPAAPATFHIRQSVARRPTMKPHQRFTLVFIDKAGDAPSVFVEENCPSWPTYVLSNQMIEQLGVDLFLLDWLSPDLGYTWVGVTVNYTHAVTTDCIIMLRRRGIRLSDKEERDLLDKFFTSRKPPHMRHNMKVERAALRNKYREKVKVKDVIIVDDSDSDVAIVSDGEVIVAVGDSRKRKRIKTEPSSPPHPRPRLTIDTSSAMLGDAASSLPPSSTITTGSSLFTTASTRSTPATSPVLSSSPTSPAPSPAPSSSHTGQWPRGQYTIDMAAGFERMVSKELKVLPRPERFRQAFGEQWEYHKGDVSGQRPLLVLEPITISEGRGARRW
ncbi:hypothetical protein DFH07DRAFT_778948 [Mycena maculata]|uniref:Uncharacterized protein n=1 Tax=Mycena maculata TaxID=230809 RepID=A0AAD7IAJ0_9AGAR|nr:hypothetical protein DFH07DRAFT_778948 [Mycena maculata]